MAQAIGPVLIVDDDADSRAFVALIVRMLGFDVVMATDGEEALALARQYQPSLILLDLMMPGFDGFSFREAQLLTPDLAAIPVVLISALHETQIRRRLGSVPAVSKPIDIDELIDQVVANCASPGDPAQRG